MEHIGKRIKREHRSLRERGLPTDSFFHVKFSDGSERQEHDLNWSEISEPSLVNFFGRQKVVYLSKQPISVIRIMHGDLSTKIDVGESEKVYQAIVSTALYQSDGNTSNRIIGRIVGRVRDGVVLEERFLSGRTGEITGLKL